MSDTTDMQQAVADARKFAAQFAGFMKACDQLGKIANIEQAAEESRQRLAKAKAEEDAYFEALEAKAKQRDDAFDSAFAEKKKHIEAVAKEMLDEAESDAAGIRREAEIEVQHARDEVRRLHDQAAEKQRLLDQMTGRKEQTTRDLEAKRGEFVRLAGEVEALTIKRDEITAHLEALKAKF